MALARYRRAADLRLLFVLCGGLDCEPLEPVGFSCRVPTLGTSGWPERAATSARRPYNPHCNSDPGND